MLSTFTMLIVVMWYVNTRVTVTPCCLPLFRPIINMPLMVTLRGAVIIKGRLRSFKCASSALLTEKQCVQYTVETTYIFSRQEVK